MTDAVIIPEPICDQALATASERQPDWLWQGFVSPGQVTLLTSLWKAGKTTLLSMLLSRRKAGGSLAGLAVLPGKSVVVTEEPPALWAERARHYDFGGKVWFFCRPFRCIPQRHQWLALLDRILQVRDQQGADLVVVDPLAPYLRAENSARNVLDTLLPLAELTYHGMAVLMSHHPGKGDRQVGQAARGSGALLGHVDISIEMRHPGGDPFTRRRRFLSLSRHAATPRQLLLELNAGDSDYVPVAEEAGEKLEFDWNAFRMVLEDARRKLTRADILADWPEDFDKPSLASLRRWLDAAVDSKMIARDGSGRRNDPFRYWLPEREQVWKRTNPLYEIEERQHRERHLLDFDTPLSQAKDADAKRAEAGYTNGEPGASATGACKCLPGTNSGR